MIAEKRGDTELVKALADAGAKGPPKLRPADRPVKAVPEKPDAALIRESAESAIRLLQESAVVSRESALRHVDIKRGCLNCHQHYLPLAAMGQAKDRAVRLDREAVAELGDQVAAQAATNGDIAEVDLFLDQVTGVGYRAFGSTGDHRPANANTDSWVHQIAVVQAADGRWPAFTLRPPMQYSDVSATALAIMTIRHYGWAGRKAEFDAAVDRGCKWLWTVKAESTEDAAYQLLGLHWAGEPAEKLIDIAKALLSRQRKDGGCGRSFRSWRATPTRPGRLCTLCRGPPSTPQRAATGNKACASSSGRSARMVPGTWSAGRTRSSPRWTAASPTAAIRGSPPRGRAGPCWR